jgi:hypothetical protein
LKKLLPDSSSVVIATKPLIEFSPSIGMKEFIQGLNHAFAKCVEEDSPRKEIFDITSSDSILMDLEENFSREQEKTRLSLPLLNIWQPLS